DVLELAGDDDLVAVGADRLDPHGPRARLELGVLERDRPRAGVDHPVDPLAVPAHDDHDPVPALAGRAPFASPRAVERKAFLRDGGRRDGKADPHSRMTNDRWYSHRLASYPTRASSASSVVDTDGHGRATAPSRGPGRF